MAPKPMTVLHIVDYAMTDPVAQRLVEEVVKRLPASEFAVSLVSSGEALDRVRILAGRLGREVGMIDSPTLVHRFAVALGPDAQYSGRPTYEVLSDTFAAADLLWFPYAHDHLLAHQGLARTVATFHDPSPVERAEFLADKSDAVGAATCTAMAALADMATRRLMGSSARVVAPSRRIADYLAAAYKGAADLVPMPTPSLLDVPAEPVADLPQRYMLHAGDIGPLGNHESVLMAQARLKAQGAVLPLVLAGEGTDQLAAGADHRAAYLRGLAGHLGLTIGADIHLLGELPPGAWKTVFSQSSGVVLPALAEGSALPLAGQAAELGVPLAAADMPGPRDYFARRGIVPLWFRPGAADEIAAVMLALRDVPPRPPAILPDTRWDAAAQSYLTIFREQAILAASQAGDH